MNWREIAKRSLHPTQFDILEAMERVGKMSPVDYLGQVRDEVSLGTVSHHFRRLRGYGVIEVASTEQRRGAIKSSYRLTRRARS